MGKVRQTVQHMDTTGDAVMSDKEYKLVDEKVLEDGKTKLRFFVRTSNAPTFDEIMDELVELAAESIVRKDSQ